VSTTGQAYDSAPFLVGGDEVDRLSLSCSDPEVLDIRGACPRCHHFVHFVIHRREFGPTADAPAQTGAGLAGFVRMKVLNKAEAVLPETRQIALNCNCGETHKDGKAGCGAWFNLGVTGKPLRLVPGDPRLSLYEVQNAQTRDQLASTELDRVRSAAVSWKTGLAALFALIPTLVVVKGTDTVDKLSTSDKTIVGGLIAFGAALALLGTLVALRAAYGPLKRGKVLGDDATVPLMSEVQKTVFAIRMTRWITIVGSAAIAAAIGYTWAAPAVTPSSFSVTLTDKRAFCGTLVTAGPEAVQVETSDGRTTSIPLARIAKTAFVSSC